MTVDIQETSAVERTLNVSIPQEDLKAPFEKKVQHYRKEVQLKGFRQGSVPKQMIVARFGDAIRQEVVDETVNSLLTEELKKSNIIPVGRLQVVDFKDDKENPISIVAKVEVDPVIDIKGYDSLGITVPDTMILEDEVNAEYNRLLQMWSRDEHVDRAAEKGDVVVGNYIEVVIDGQTQELPEQKEFRSLLGESASPGFDEGLMGVKEGETREIAFTYPEDHKEEKYRGKNATFKVEITDVRAIVPPVMDEEFFKQLGVKDDAELKSNIQESLVMNKRNAAKAKAVNEAIDKLIEMNPFEVPNARVEDLVKYTLNRHSENPSEVPAPSEEEMKTLSPEAIREIKKHRILEFVANTEKLKVTQAQVDERLQQMADAYHVDFDSMKAHFRQSGRIIALREEIRFEMAADFIVGIRPAAEEKSDSSN